ncbi:MAG: T9SS type A sorting domain-containing protein [candidate division Zixibacteria bacterium]|nr:T9SS type A sorting domain-containing protein [Candidatus Tariuqbacter arcticus]
MKSITIILTVLILSCGIAFAQPPDTLWTRTYGGTLDDRGECVQQTTDGGYILAGCTKSYGAGNYDFYLVKTNAAGDTLWARACGGSTIDWARSVQQTTDGGYILAGYTQSYGAGSKDFYLVKTNSAGDTLWTRTYGGSGDDQGYSVQQTTDGGYILSGATMSYGAGSKDCYLIKTDSAGDTLWTRTYGGNHIECARSIQQTTDGGYIVAGYTGSYGAGAYDVYLIKTDSNGDSLWTRTYGGEYSDQGFSVQQTTDGGYVVAGDSPNYSAGVTGLYLMKTNATGDTVWTRTYSGSVAVKGYSVQQTTDGGYIVAGDDYSFGAVSWNPYLVRTDAAGDSLWTHSYIGSVSSECHSVRQTTDGGYVAAGYTSDYGAGLFDFYLIRLEGEAPPPIFEVILTPYNPPIQIPATGGSFDFNIEVNNNGAFSVIMDFWTMVTLPNGQEIGPIIFVTDYILNGFSSVSRDRTQEVPAHAPTGNYIYDGYLGTYPFNINAEDHFNFEKLAISDGGTIVHDWYSWGESFDDITGEASMGTPNEFMLSSAYPNPFNPSTAISYQLQAASYVELTIYDIQGREVAKLVDDYRPAGTYEAVFNASNLSGGVYFARLTAGNYQQTQKLLLVK